MRTPQRLLFITLMTAALGFGFLHLIIPGYNFERLHIFLFNLCTGGTIIIWFTEEQQKLSPKATLFFITTLLFTLSAFLHWYPVAIACAVLLAILTESVRIKRFALLPTAFFRRAVPTAEKFHQASLLCLSLGLMLSILAMVNNQYTRWFTFEKLTLNTFFLGFSFPVSLITLSVVFTMMHKAKDTLHRNLKLVCFWSINLGVIIFFLFILLKIPVMEVVMSSLLFLTVCTILYLYIRLGIREQQKAFLTSGIVFLVASALSGIAYIVLSFFTEYDPVRMKFLLRMHALISLYGWNLNGLAVIIRYHDFPIRLHSNSIIGLHWLVVVILAPLGYLSAWTALIAVTAYAWFLRSLFFSKGVAELPPFCRDCINRALPANLPTISDE